MKGSVFFLFCFLNRKYRCLRYYILGEKYWYLLNYLVVWWPRNPSNPFHDSRKMKVKCCDGVVLKLEDALVYASSTVRKLIGENISSRRCLSVCLLGGSQGENCEISFAVEISSKTLLKINEYVKKHADAEDNEKSLRNWDLEFIKVDRRTLFTLVLVSNFCFSHVLLIFLLVTSWC